MQSKVTVSLLLYPGRSFQRQSMNMLDNISRLKGTDLPLSNPPPPPPASDFFYSNERRRHFNETLLKHLPDEFQHFPERT